MKTFVVRLFVPADSAPEQRAGELAGLVEEIGSGRRWAFAGGGELLDFLAADEDEGSAADETPNRKDRG